MQERALWARRVAASLRAGVSLVDALEAARDRTDSFELAGPVGVIADRVRFGARLADALEEHPEVFTPIEIATIRAAESGDLAAALEGL